MNQHIETPSLVDLFRLEVEQHRASLSDGLIALERGNRSPQLLEGLMRSAHSIKGAARIVNRVPAVEVAHAMEDCLVAVQKGHFALSSPQIDKLLEGVDLLREIAELEEDALPAWTQSNHDKLMAFPIELAAWLSEPAKGLTEAASMPLPSDAAPAASALSLRVTADNVNRLLALAGESRVASRWLDEFVQDMIRLKSQGRKLSRSIGAMRHSLDSGRGESTKSHLVELDQQTQKLNALINEQIEQLDQFDRRFLNLSTRLYDEVLDTRMRPFADGIQAFPRMVRDLARSLGKEATLEVSGESTPADREVLEKLEAPLTHLLRNALDHGLELPEIRRQAGKPPVGTLRLEARHSAGMLLVTVSDDGTGIEVEAIRNAVVSKKLTTAEVAAKMSETELLEFLFLPGFTLKGSITELSGRGVGLDVVQSMVKEVGGRVRISSRPGRGTNFHLELPLTLSVVRTLLVEIAGEGYAFPLTRLMSVLKLQADQVKTVQGRPYFDLNGEKIGLVDSRQMFGLESRASSSSAHSVVVVGDRTHRYGLVVDAFLNERELVVLPLDQRLGKVPNISAAALLPDRTPVLIVDVDDILRSIENIVSEGRLTRMGQTTIASGNGNRKRVLVVDDSLTVRELERKLLDHRGYAVDVAVDGMDGWNAVRSAHYDLVIADVDMPRMDGIELVSLIKKDARLSAIPVMIVSYKDREEDRQRGLQAGASYYLTKASFHDETLLQAVADLIGESES
jgi:two-component system, chemotaxis family, sensor histidine kinase and response regulator WspE